METGTIEATEGAEQQAAATNAVPEKMFKFSKWVHVGEGAAECAHVAENPKHEGQGCEDPEHFHAWCRLPNQFQHRDIVEKATAAKARRIRLLSDRESDAYEVLEGTLRAIASDDSTAHVIEELLGYTWREDYLDAINEVETEDQFEHIAADREELNRLLDMPEEDRPAEPVESLEKHLADYMAAIRKRVEELQAPRRTAYEGLSDEELLKILRDRRVEADSDDEYQHTFSQWEWFVGTRAPDKRSPKFERISQMTEDAPPEVIETLRNVFTELRIAMQGGGPGNS